MTKVVPDQCCSLCDGMLVPPTIATGSVPEETDYVCVKCGRCYQWIGNPPKLTLLAMVLPTPPDAA